MTWSRLAGAPGVTRTPDLLVRSQTLYPTELRAQVVRTPFNLSGPTPLRKRALDLRTGLLP